MTSGSLTIPVVLVFGSTSSAGFSTEPSGSLRINPESPTPSSVIGSSSSALFVPTPTQTQSSNSGSVESASISQSSTPTSLSFSNSNPQFPTSTNEPSAILQSDKESPTTIEPAASSSTTVSPSANPGDTNNTSPSPSGTPGSFNDLSTSPWPRSPWPISMSTAGNFAPLLAARGLMLLLAAFYNQLLTHDPVRRLTDPAGISGADLAGGSPSGIAHIGMLVAQVGTCLAAAATAVDTNYCNIAPGAAGNLNPCPPRLSANQWVLDAILAILAVQVLVVVYAASKWFRKPGSLSADPTTIAGVAVVMGHPEVDGLFATFPGDMSEKELKEALGERQFRLGTWTAASGGGGVSETGGLERFGIIPVPWQEVEKKKKKKGGYSSLGASVTAGKERFAALRSSKYSSACVDAVFGALLLGLLGLVLAAVIDVDRPRKVFLASESANGTGMRIFFAILGVAVSLYWGRLFQNTQTFSPYSPLSTGEARPRPTILLSRHTSPLCAFIPLLRNRHTIAASVALTGIASEFLIVVLAGLPYRAGQLRSEFLFCGIVSAIILFFMLAQLVFVVLWRRSLPQLPRRPDTIGAVMTYIAGTNMARDFQGLEELSTSERDKAIRQMDKVYAYGWRREDSGMMRWIVEEVPEEERKAFLAKSREGEGEGEGRVSDASGRRRWA
ncbi:hypothetical protein B0T17DRAFT_486261 [Bombardia bombarda]|uniref:Uncharacterized protein n=1 Tax=Bombardia bombarda TaxID=252184 RepID=A0AA40C7G8_9PEZI|nr:hypothetical protein B0T17DRAFT_486261 [Bombardia bombarda]